MVAITVLRVEAVLKGSTIFNMNKINIPFSKVSHFKGFRNYLTSRLMDTYGENINVLIETESYD